MSFGEPTGILATRAYVLTYAWEARRQRSQKGFKDRWHGLGTASCEKEYSGLGFLLEVFKKKPYKGDGIAKFASW